MKKLFVAGCSLSDYTRVDKVYGEVLAKKLGYDYVHEGAGCGSNHRIWRVITNHVMSGSLTSDDLLVVQYTGRERDEFWSCFDQPEAVFRPHTVNNLCIIDRMPLSGSIIRYKASASQWQNIEEERVFFNMYEKYFLNVEFERERFRTGNFMFQHMLLRNNIKTIFVRSRRSPPLSDSDMLPEFISYLFTEPEENISMYDLATDDVGHMSQSGHEVFAQWLFEFINRE